MGRGPHQPDPHRPRRGVHAVQLQPPGPGRRAHRHARRPVGRPPRRRGRTRRHPAGDVARRGRPRRHLPADGGGAADDRAHVGEGRVRVARPARHRPAPDPAPPGAGSAPAAVPGVHQARHRRARRRARRRCAGARLRRTRRGRARCAEIYDDGIARRTGERFVSDRRERPLLRAVPHDRARRRRPGRAGRGAGPALLRRGHRALVRRRSAADRGRDRGRRRGGDDRVARPLRRPPARGGHPGRPAGRSHLQPRPRLRRRRAWPSTTSNSSRTPAPTRSCA